MKHHLNYIPGPEEAQLSREKPSSLEPEPSGEAGQKLLLISPGEQ